MIIEGDELQTDINRWRGPISNAGKNKWVPSQVYIINIKRKKNAPTP